MDNENTQYSISRTHDGITGSRTFFTRETALAHVRTLLDADPCVKLAIDKYTPTADELREMDEAAQAADNDWRKAAS